MLLKLPRSGCPSSAGREKLILMLDSSAPSLLVSSVQSGTSVPASQSSNLGYKLCCDCYGSSVLQCVLVPVLAEDLRLLPKAMTKEVCLSQKRQQELFHNEFHCHATCCAIGRQFGRRRMNMTRAVTMATRHPAPNFDITSHSCELVYRQHRGFFLPWGFWLVLLLRH